MYPFCARMQTKTCAVLIGVINLLSMAFTAPYMYIMDSVEILPGETQCQVNNQTFFDQMLKGITK